MAETGVLTYFFLPLAILVTSSVCQQYNKVGYSTVSDLSLDCVQCNMRQMGIMNTCKSPAQRHNCSGCMKTLTRIRLKDSGDIYGKYRISEVVSRYCMLNGASNVKEEGCYRHPNNGGYTIQCFCYTHNCNSHAAPAFKTAAPTFVFTLFIVVVMATIQTTSRWI